jgi:RNA polymerase-binding transcription factor DksA
VDLDVYEREKQLALARRLEQKLDEINRALQIAKKGAYGICERCGKPIDPERLQALPETTLCVKCKNELEKAARRARV